MPTVQSSVTTKGVISGMLTFYCVLFSFPYFHTEAAVVLRSFPRILPRTLTAATRLPPLLPRHCIPLPLRLIITTENDPLNISVPHSEEPVIIIVVGANPQSQLGPGDFTMRFSEFEAK